MAKKSDKKVKGKKEKTKKEEKKKKVKKGKKVKKQKDKKKKKEKSKSKGKKEKKKKKAKRKKQAVTIFVKEVQAPVKEAPKKVVAKKINDHSANYNTKQALVILRSLKNEKDVKAFIRGEKRVTITRSVNAVLKRLGASH